MELQRTRARIVVDISVVLTTVLDSVDARIIDLSEHGAQIIGAALPKGTKFQIEYMGQTVYAQCMWSEIDRMGVRFPFSMTNGPLHDALLMATPSKPNFTEELPSSPHGGFMPPSTGFGTASARRHAPVSFGRRNTL